MINDPNNTSMAPRQRTPTPEPASPNIEKPDKDKDSKEKESEDKEANGDKGEDEAASADKETSAEKKDGGEKPEEEEPIIYKMPTYLPLPVDDDGNHKSVRIPDSASPFKEVDEDFFEKAKKVSESFFRKLHIKRRLETRLSNGFFHLFISKN